MAAVNARGRRRRSPAQALVALIVSLVAACSVDYGTLRGTGATDGRSDADTNRDTASDAPRDAAPPIDASADAPTDLPIADAAVDVAAPADAAPDTGDVAPPFAHRKAIAIRRSKVGDDSTTSLTAYPVLVVLEDPDLRAAGSGGKVQSDQGEDIRFVATTADTCGGPAPCTLEHEFERYLPATGSLIAWVRVPVLNGKAAASDTVIHLYYGSSMVRNATAAAVWDPGFAGVWHLAEDAVELGMVVDSTANANAGKAVNVVTAGAAGPIGTGFELDGSGGHVEIPDSPTLDLGGNGAVSLWYRSDAPGTWRSLVSKGPLTNGAGETVNYAVELNLTDQLAFYLGNGVQDFSSYTGPHPNTPEFHHVAMVWDQGMLARYLDGAPLGPPIPLPIAPGANAIPLRFGIYSSELKDPLDGVLDEIRISRAPRSAAWIATDYQNQSAPAAFYTVGPEETPPR
jgi:hypothetical protein